MSSDFSGQVAIVTGATRGIGLAVARELVSRGARVAVTARKAEELDRAVHDLGGEEVVLGVRGGADDPEHQAATVATVLDRFGRIDLLVNNAAVNPHFGLLTEVDPGVVRKTFEVNVLAPLAWTQQVWNAGLRDHGGSIVNVASIGGLRSGPFLGVYNMTKAALIHQTRQLAQELGPDVRVNAVAPAVVKTQFARALYEGREEQAAAAYPTKRLGTPEDVAGLVAFLLSAEASWITGECVVIDGGLLVSAAWPS
ncbi:MAG TPA: SDR family oxidoreductase [Mycobacteriales bacterium]|nr:SDR family oxidoreductase [Mycobacteriales bacterium]